jgi:hypothetical protein
MGNGFHDREPTLIAGRTLGVLLTAGFALATAPKRRATRRSGQIDNDSIENNIVDFLNPFLFRVQS